MDDLKRQEVIAAVEAATRSFEAGERAADVDWVIAHFAPVPGFHVHDDGQRLDYEAITANLRTAFSSLRSIEGGFHDIQVVVLAPDAALATPAFAVITDATGDVMRVRGAGAGVAAQFKCNVVSRCWRI